MCIYFCRHEEEPIKVRNVGEFKKVVSFSPINNTLVGVSWYCVFKITNNCSSTIFGLSGIYYISVSILCLYNKKMYQFRKKYNV